jgi:hypothetical protein
VFLSRRQQISTALALLCVWSSISPAQNAPTASVLPVTVVIESPADTMTELQIICLFRSLPENTLNGSLKEIDEKLHGLLGQIRSPALFGGEFGETVLLTPPSGSIGAKRLLIIGLGERASFTPARMYLVGKIALREAARLGVAHPIFAPTVLDGGVSQFPTGDVAEQVARGLRDASSSESVLRKHGSGGAATVVDFTFLAGATHAADTQAGIDRALGKP